MFWENMHNTFLENVFDVQTACVPTESIPIEKGIKKKKTFSKIDWKNRTISMVVYLSHSCDSYTSRYMVHRLMPERINKLCGDAI